MIFVNFLYGDEFCLLEELKIAKSFPIPKSYISSSNIRIINLFAIYRFKKNACWNENARKKSIWREALEAPCCWIKSSAVTRKLNLQATILGGFKLMLCVFQSGFNFTNIKDQVYQQVVLSTIKVHIFWESHKFLRNLHPRFVLCKGQ